MKNCLPLKKYTQNLISRQELYSTGATKTKSNQSEQTLDTEDIFYLSQIQRIMLHEEKYATAEYLRLHKKKIWIDKLSSSDLNTLTMKLLETLDQELISREKVLTPFWNQQKMDMSKKLWLPTKIDCVDSVLNSSTESLPNGPMGKSWFSITKKHPLNKNSLATSFQSSQFSLPDSTVSGVTISNVKSKKARAPKTVQKQMKTLKFRLFPTDEEKKKLNLQLEQQRWYYNAAINVLYKNNYIDNFKSVLKDGTEKISISRDKIRDLMRKIEFKEDNNFKTFVFNENIKSFPIPEWWNLKELKPKERVIRGAFDKLGSNINSALSNKLNGNIKDFNMKFRSKKDYTEFMRFEDYHYPAYINKIKSHYWYRTKSKHRKTLKFNSIIECQKCCGIEIIHDKITDFYFPEDDIRNNSQVKYKTEGNSVISLDPGVRKFLVGYDPEGSMVFIGDGAHKKLAELLLDIDKETDKVLLYIKWKKVKNLVNELHWKAISFLIENYDHIIIPEFRIQNMIRSKKISKMTKRLMVMFSFHKFKERLLWKCQQHNKKFILVTEEYTSKTCTVCGVLNDTEGKEVLKCCKCGIIMDRDVIGSRNIFIKNSGIRCATMGKSNF